MASLRDQTISGVFWSFLQRIGSRGIQFVITIILARLLTPFDFGLIGMLAIFIAISQALTDAGFNKALIQKKDVSEQDYSSVFYINLVVSILVYGVLFFAAPWIADFYSQPQLTLLTRVLSIVFVINAFGFVQETRLKKKVDFKRLMIIHLPSTLISGIVAIIMAYQGFGVWAIVAQQVVMRFAFVIQLWLYSNWVPKREFSVKRVRNLFAFGGNLMVVGIVQTIYLNAYKVVIGKFYPANLLGYYENANNLASVPISTISGVLSSVTFPVFSSIQDDNRRLKVGYKRTIQSVLFIICPLIVLSMAVATPLFHFVLGEKWLPAVPFFQILAIGFIFRPLNAYNIEMLNVKGESRLFLKIDLLKKVVETIGIAICLIYFDIWALIWFQSLFTIVKYIFNSYYSGKFINYSTMEQLKDISGIVLISGIIGILVFYLLSHFLSDVNDFLKVLVGYGIGFLTYFLFAKIFKVKALEDSLDVINSVIKKLKRT